MILMIFIDAFFELPLPGGDPRTCQLKMFVDPQCRTLFKLNSYSVKKSPGEFHLSDRGAKGP